MPRPQLTHIESALVRAGLVESPELDLVPGGPDGAGFQPVWRLHSDAVNRQLIERWLPRGRAKRVLKTDLFDEAVSAGLYPALAGRAESFTGIDISVPVLSAARSRYPGIEAVRADVRRLPFAAGEFELVVSPSTLDHFSRIEDIGVALREIHRVLEPGGLLLLTLDNGANPIVAIRNALPFERLHRLGVLPYYVGATYGPRRLRRMLDRAGFRVNRVGSVLHCPRILAVPAAAVLASRGSARAKARFLRLLRGFEVLGGLPTRFLTGHFVAVLAARD
jgi:SAM-dependent methyltransferase